MPFTYLRTIHFPDTDAAGVVFFARYLSICHEAYEEALGAAGINLQQFFSKTEVVVPISKSSADYLRPLRCGDKVRVTVKPTKLTENTFAVDYQMTRIGPPEKLVAEVRTCHVCIRESTRERAAFPPELAAWIAAQ